MVQRFIFQGNVHLGVLASQNDFLHSPVSCLINPATGTWHLDLEQAIFLQSDCEAILSIPLGCSANDDELIWHYSKSGPFCVKTDYSLAQSIKFRQYEESRGSSSTAMINNFSFLWNCKIPPEVKHFAWHAACGCLPTNDALFCRKIIHHPFYDIYQCKEEDVLHCLLHCHFARQVWALSSLPYTSIQHGATSILSWFKKVQEGLDNPSFCLFLVCCWALWFRRNDTKFGELIWSPLEVVEFAKKFMDRLQSSVQVCFLPSSLGSAVSWAAPRQDQIKINFDTAVFKDVKAIGIGHRDHWGQCLAWESRLFSARLDQEAAEAVAAKSSCETCLQFAWPNVTIEDDCLAVISALKSQYELFPISQLLDLYLRCKEVSSRMVLIFTPSCSPYCE